MKSTTSFTYISLILLVYQPKQLRVCGQKSLNDICNLAGGKSGKCIRFKDCPGAIKQVQKNESRPYNCGFDGLEPIVCCEIIKEYFDDLPKIPRLPGEISKQKCNQTYSIPIYRDPSLIFRNISQEDLEVAIIGGIFSEAEEFPHMAILGYGDSSNISWLCGGSLISEKFVLTAAHCIDTRNGKVKMIRLGELDLNSTTDVADPHDFAIARTIKHPKYQPPSLYHDIALIELASQPLFSSFIQPACLYTQRTFPDSLWIATGWGLTSFGGERSTHLQKVGLRQTEFDKCKEAYDSTTSKRRLPNGIDPETQLCAWELEKDTCQGDSGGPLQIHNTDFYEGYLLIAITSFGKACAIGTSPSVYTRISFYVPWIESIVWPE